MLKALFDKALAHTHLHRTPYTVTGIRSDGVIEIHELLATDLEDAENLVSASVKKHFSSFHDKKSFRPIFSVYQVKTGYLHDDPEPTGLS